MHLMRARQQLLAFLLRHGRSYRTMIARGKKPTVVVTALARELAGFIWAIGQEMRTPMTT